MVRDAKQINMDMDWHPNKAHYFFSLYRSAIKKRSVFRRREGRRRDV